MALFEEMTKKETQEVEGGSLTALAWTVGAAALGIGIKWVLDKFVK